MEDKECLATPLFRLPASMHIKNSLIRYVSVGLDVRGFWFLRFYDYNRSWIATQTYNLDGDGFEIDNAPGDRIVKQGG